MRLIYSKIAARQLADILDYIDERNPQGALNVKRRIQHLLGLLVLRPFAFPPIGHRGLRRLVVNPYPYVITYRVTLDDEVEILRLRHAARRPI